MTADADNAVPVPDIREPGGAPSTPAPTFTVTGVAAARLAVTPTLTFRVALECGHDVQVRSITLVTEIRIAAARRRYRDDQYELLTELFGPPKTWGATMRPLPWTRVTSVVGPFSGTTEVDLPVVCSYDVELAVTKYFHAVGEDEVPLDFLFSGTVFHTGPDGRLRTCQISWSSETTYRMPAERWHEAVRACSPGQGWLRLSQESYEQLYAYRAGHALTSWDETVQHVLDRAERASPGAT